MASPTAPLTENPPPNVKTYTQEEVDRMAAKAREDEKQKLYPDIERHKKDAQRLADEKKALEAQVEGMKSSATEAQTLKGEIQKLQANQDSMTEKFQATMSDILDQQKKAFDAQTRKNELDALRRELIAGCGGQCIASLVGGDTEEAIRSSFERSKAEYLRIATEAEAKIKKEYEEKLQGALPGPVQTGAADSSTDSQGGLENWRKMSPADWEANKKKIIEEQFKKAGLQVKAGINR